MSVSNDNPTPVGTIRWYDSPIAFFGGTFVGVVLTAIAGIVALVIAMRSGYHPDQAGLITLMQTSFWANQVSLVGTDLGLVFVMWLVARRRFPGPVAQYFPPVTTGTWALAIAAGVALSIVTNGGNEFLSRVTNIEFHDSVVERALVPHGPAQFITAIAVIALFAPFVEEFFFRGLFFTWLRQAGGLWTAILVSALVFAAVHGQIFQHPGAQGWIYTAELFVAGVVLALFAWRFASLRASFAVHAAFNATAVVFSVLFP